MPPAPWSGAPRANEADSSSNVAFSPLSIGTDRGSVPPVPGANAQISPSDAELVDLSDENMSDV